MELNLQAATMLLGLSIILLLALLLSKNSPRSPPGPRGIPVFGYIFHMRRLLKSPLDFQKLVQRHGPMMQIRVGSMPLIVISSPAIAHEALIEKGSLFSSRPEFISRRQLLMSNHRRTINSASYGAHWRTTRRNLVSHVLHPGKLHVAFQPVRHRAVSELVQLLRRSNPVPVLSTVRLTVFSVLAYMCFGEWLGEDRVRDLESLMREIINGVRAGRLSDFVPLLRVFRLGSTQEEPVDELKLKRDGVLVPLVERSKKLADSGELDENSYFASLLNLREELGLTDEDLVALCSEFLNAGADTTANTLEWCLACLIKHPGVQAKLYDEISSQVGENEEISEQHLEKLVYLQAFVKETLRMHPPGYTTLPHAVSRPCKLAGYDIPTNASLLFNIYAISHDPQVWKNPSDFLPDRFLGDGGVHVDYSAATSGQLSLIPFGAGRRICPGLGLATLHIHYILARLVQEFVWRCEEGCVVDLTPRQEFTVVMKNPLRALVSMRGK